MTSDSSLRCVKALKTNFLCLLCFIMNFPLLTLACWQHFAHFYQFDACTMSMMGRLSEILCLTFSDVST